MRRVPLAAVLFVSIAASCGGDAGDPQVGACEDYCALVQVHCTAALSQYPDQSTCMRTCEAMPLGDPAQPTGNTVACRTFQAAAAELTGATTCTAAGPGGGEQCGTQCESFCQLADEICTGDFQAFASTDECLAACRTFPADPPFDSGDVAGDSFECRLYHLTAAATDPAIHCAHIVSTSPVCF
ncbi:MAG: hypothetical protein R3B06_23015 [Kofleriaceae bacterium]